MWGTEREGFGFASQLATLVLQRDYVRAAWLLVKCCCSCSECPRLCVSCF